MRHLWRSRRALLRGQHLRERLLFQWQLHRGRFYLQHQQHLEHNLRAVQVWPLHLRQRWRALLPQQHFPDGLRLFELRSRVHQQHGQLLHQLGLRQVRQARRSLLRRQHLHRYRGPVSV